MQKAPYKKVSVIVRICVLMLIVLAVAFSINNFIACKVMENEVAERFGYEIVNVIPMPKAGGSLSTAAWKIMKDPVAVERIQAHAGIDIGDTLIGMHLKSVAVPFRIEHPQIGSAHIVCARTRAKYVGGERAHYDAALE